MDAELAHEAGDHAEEGNVLEIAGTDEIIKAVRAVRRKRAGNFDGELAFGRVELGFEISGAFAVSLAGSVKLDSVGADFPCSGLTSSALTSLRRQKGQAHTVNKLFSWR